MTFCWQWWFNSTSCCFKPIWLSSVEHKIYLEKCLIHLIQFGFLLLLLLAIIIINWVLYSHKVFSLCTVLVISTDSEGQGQKEQVTAASRQHATPLQSQATSGNRGQSALRPQRALDVAGSSNSVDQSMARFGNLKKAKCIV